MDNSSMVGDQIGGNPPYDSLNQWPNEHVRIDDLYFISGKFGHEEGDTYWTLEHYLADIIADRKIRADDVLAASLNFGNDGVYNYNLTGVYVRFDSEQTNYYIDDNGFVSIPEGKEIFTVYRNGNTIGALATFWYFSPPT